MCSQLAVFEMLYFNGRNVSILKLQNPHYMKEKFMLVVETLHVADSGMSENVSEV